MGNCHLQADVFLAPQIAIATVRFNIDMVKHISDFCFRLLFSV